MPSIDVEHLSRRLFDDIRVLTSDSQGVTRASYGAGESAAADYLHRFATAEGLSVDRDRAGNIVFRQPGPPTGGSVVWVGSHLDSVPQGGNYDGLAGVVAGLLCLLQIEHGDGGGGLPLEVIGFRGEESAWFGKAHVGSTALLGDVTEADLQLARRGSGRTLADSMLDCGADMQAIRAGQPLFDKTRVKAFLELHIEQGPVMVARELPLAVVSSVRGNLRHNQIVCIGEAQHSGVTPRRLRHDAAFAVSDLIMRLDVYWRSQLEAGADLVVTSGIMTTDPAEHSVSRIPGHLSFSLEARSTEDVTLDAFMLHLHAECDAIASERGVRFRFDRGVRSRPASMNASIREYLLNACRQSDIACDTLPSGAGHDAAIFANAGVPSGMLFVRNQNGSHNPHEAMEIEDFVQGVRALGTAIDQLRAVG